MKPDSQHTLVIGGANVDVVATPGRALVAGDSNPGTVRVSFGGVGRNIAENMARLGAEVHLVSMFGDDLLGRLGYQSCVDCGIHMEHSAFTDRHGTSTYVAVLEESRGLHVAVSDMAILGELTIQHVSAALGALTPDDVCVVDANLDEDLLTAIAQRCPCALVLDPISAAKAPKAKSILSHLTVLKPNRQEAEVLCGFALKGPRDHAAAIDWFHAQGIREVLISLGEEGVVASDGTGLLSLRLPEVRVVDSTGAGDSFLAAYLVSRERGAPFEERVRAAMRVARRTLECAHTVDPDLNEHALDGQPFERIPQ